METMNVFRSLFKIVQMLQVVSDNAGSVNKQVNYFNLGWEIQNGNPGFIHYPESNQVRRH
jgi:hypothetical protein